MDEDERDEKRPRGRPTDLTDDIADSIIADVELGCSDRTAAECAGVTPEKLSKWLRSRPDFRRRVNEARATRKRRLMRHMVRGATGRDEKWNHARMQTALAILRAHEPETFSEKQRVEHTGSIGIFQAAIETIRANEAAKQIENGEDVELLEAGDSSGEDQAGE